MRNGTEKGTAKVVHVPLVRATDQNIANCEDSAFL